MSHRNFAERVSSPNNDFALPKSANIDVCVCEGFSIAKLHSLSCPHPAPPSITMKLEWNGKRHRTDFLGSCMSHTRVGYRRKKNPQLKLDAPLSQSKYVNVSRRYVLCVVILEFQVKRKLLLTLNYMHVCVRTFLSQLIISFFAFYFRFVFRFLVALTAVILVLRFVDQATKEEACKMTELCNSSPSSTVYYASHKRRMEEIN